MATYVRQSSFSDGDTITAALFNNEFNQLVNAFNVATGHTHDGSTAGDGGPISNLFSNALVFGTNTNNDVVITFNATSNDGVLTWMEDEDYFQFSDDLLLTTTEKVQFRDTAIYINSSTDGQLDIVADTEVQIAATTIDMNGNADISGNLGVGGNLTVTGTTTFNGGTITMGDAATDNVVFGADVDSNIIPDDDDTYDLGSSTQQWRNLFIDGTANIDSLVADTADINGGTIDAANITVGSGKTLDVSAGSLTLADNQISGDKVEGGTINATTINTLTYGSITDGTITVTAFVDEDNMASNSATLIPTQQSVKAYVDAQDTAQDLDLVSDSGTIAIDLDGETLTVTGGEGIDTSASSNTLTITGEDATTSNKGIASFNSDDFNVSSGAVTLATTSTAAELNLLDGTTAGTIVASKGVAVDANKDITGFRNITLTGELDAGSLDISGNADIDGTLEADAITIAGVTLAETISDTVGAMVASNTETGIAVTYDDADNTLDFVIGDNAIVQSMIADNAIDSQMYVDGSIDLVHMSANSVDSDQYVDGSIDTAHIADSQITSAKIADGTIATGDIADDAVTGAKLANNIDIAGTLDVTGVLTADSNVVIAGNLTVQGDTTTLNTATLDVEDKNITLNKGAGDTSGSANGAGLTIQDAVDASNDATILWDTTNDEFDFSHPINVAGKVTSTGTSVFASLDISGDIDVDGTTNLDVVDIDGAVDMASTLAVAGVLTANAGVVVDNFTLDGTTLALSSGELTLDSAEDMTFDADGGDFIFKDGGTIVGTFSTGNNDFEIRSRYTDKDLVFKGVDGSSTITALTLDMSAAGAATFSSTIAAGAATFSTATDQAFPLTVTNTDSDSHTYIKYLDQGGQYWTTGINYASNDFVMAYGGTNLATFANAGGLSLTTADNLDTLSLISTDADANVGPNLRMYRNSGSPADSDQLGKIQYEGRNDNSQDVIYAEIGSQIKDASDGTEDGRIFINSMVAGTLQSRINILEGETVFNEESIDIDFRVESNTNTHALFVEGSGNDVGIGTSTLTSSSGYHTLSLNGSTGGQLSFQTGGSGKHFIFSSATDLNMYSAVDGALRFSTNNLERLEMTSSSTIFNDIGADTDFRVESNGNANMLVVDGGNNYVGIGSATNYSATLAVEGAKSVSNGIPYYQLSVVDNSSLATGNGGAINFWGTYTSAGDKVEGASIEAYKANSTSANYQYGMSFKTRTHGSTNIERLFLDQTGAVFNDTGVDADFRVESDVNANSIFVNGENGGISFGTTVTNMASNHNNVAGLGIANTGKVEMATTANVTALEVSKNEGTDGAVLYMRKQSTGFATHNVSSGNYLFGNPTSDKDVIITGNDGGSAINALTLDMSAAGTATFSSNIVFGDGHFIGDDADDNLWLAGGTGENIIIDSAADIYLDAAGENINLRVSGSLFGRFQRTSSAYLSVQSNGGNLRLGANNTDYWSIDEYRIYPITDNVDDIGLANNRVKDIYLSGGAFLGGTGAANKLDDYEEGTWTPVTKSGSTVITTTVNYAKYVKIGALVHVTAFVSRADAASLTGDVGIYGLPFEVAANSAQMSGSIWFDTTGTDEVATNYFIGGSSYLQAKKVGANSSYVSADQFQNGRPYYISGVYNIAI